MGFWTTLGTVAGDIGGSFIGDPMLGNQIVGGLNAAGVLGNNNGSGAASSGAGGLGGLGNAATVGLAGLGGVLGNTQGARTSTSTPTIAPGYQSLADMLKARAMSRLNMGTNLNGYQATGVNNINSAFGNAAIGQNANLEARGLATSPVAAAVTGNVNTARAGNIATFLNGIPLLQRQLQDQDISNALGQVTSLGRGTSNVGAGSAAAGGFTSAAEMLAYLNGKGVLGGGGTGGFGGFGTPTSTDTTSGLQYPY